MPLTNCTANTSRRHNYAFSIAGATALTKRIAALRWGIKGTPTQVSDEGNTGRIHKRAEDFVLDKVRVGGQTSFNLRPTDTRWLLPLIFGGTVASDSLKAAPVCAFFRCGHLDQVVDQFYEYVDCIVSRATLSSNDSSGSLLQVSLDIEATQENKNAGSTWPPSLALPTSQPLVHSNATLTLSSKTVRLKDVQIVVDNHLLADEFYNSRYRGDFPSDGQTIQLIHSSPFDTADDVALTNITGPVSAVIEYKTATMGVKFTFPALTALPPPPDIDGKGTRVLNQYTWEAVLATGATDTDSVVTIDIDDTV